MAPSSSSTLSNAPLGPISLPLFKLSHCTITNPGARMLWTHLTSGDDTFAVFDEVRSRDLDGTVSSKQVMKLIRGGELLETVDFDSLKHQARMDQERAQSQSIPDELLYVVIIAKRPLLALRYRLPDGKIRRLQMNFRPASGCDTALDILKPLGLPLRVKQDSEQPRSTEQRPYSSQSIVTASSSRSQESRSTFKAPCNDLLPPVLPLEAKSSSNLVQDVNSANTFSKPITYVRDPRPHLQTVSSGNGADCEWTSIKRPSSESAPLGHPDQVIRMPPASRSLLPSPAFSSGLPSFGSHQGRPISAPEPQAAYHLSDAVPISQLLPPVRELPFPRKPTSQNTHGTSGLSEVLLSDLPISSQVHQSPSKTRKRATARAKALIPVSKPNSSAPKARSKRTAVAKLGSDQLPQPSNTSEGLTVVELNLDETLSSSAPPRMSSTLEALEHTVPKMSRNFTPPSSRGSTEPSKKRPLTDIDDNETNKRRNQGSTIVSTPVIQQQATQSLNPALSNMDPAGLLDSLDGWIRRYHGLQAPQAPITAKDQLAEFASETDEERAKIIDNKICEYLCDENFGKLADDVESRWKRICLGF